MADVVFENVTKRFGKVAAVENLTLEIEDGEFVVLLGPTGAGKTTTLRLAGGLEVPDHGRILIGGNDVTKAPSAVRDGAFVFQQYSLYPHYTVFDNRAFPLRAPLRRTSAAAIDARVREIARLLRIEDKLDNSATQLSGGEMQRVAIGRALVREPAAFLMDEPLSSLDAKLREDLRVEIKRIQVDLGATILYVTHDQTEAMSLATKIAVMSEGEIIQLGAPQELYDRPNSVFVADFIGSPAMNLIRGRVQVRDAKPHFVADHDGTQIALPIDHYDFERDLRADQELILGIRPEYITSGIANHHGAVSVDLELVPVLMETNGFDQYVMFEFCGGELVGRFSSKESIDVGRPHRVQLDLSEISLFDAEAESRI